MAKKTNKNQLNTYLRFSGIAIQIGLTIYLGNLLGKWLDGKFINNDELYTKICTLVAVFVAIFSVIKQVSKLSK